MSRYRFVEWRDETGAVVGTTPSLTIFIDRDKILTACYEEIPVPEYTLSITAMTGGTTSPAPGSYTYLEGTVVTVTALPDADYRFVHWELDGVVYTENPINVLMDADHSLHAVFEYVAPPPVTATIQGVVTDARTEATIAGATVTCNGYTSITDETGFYQFADIPAQAYTLTVTMMDYITETVPIDASAGGTFAQDIPLTPVVVAAVCWIATAAYGSPLAPQLHVLRHFRDRCLPNKITKTYYRFSPPIARWLAKHQNIRRVTREVLDVTINLIKKWGV